MQSRERLCTLLRSTTSQQQHTHTHTHTHTLYKTLAVALAAAGAAAAAGCGKHVEVLGRVLVRLTGCCFPHLCVCVLGTLLPGC
jgi:hypothetical protein